MKKVLQGFLIAIPVPLLLLGIGVILFTHTNSDHLSKREIFELVQNHHSVILLNIENQELHNVLSVDGIQEIDTVDGVIDFYCGGAGMGPSTSYYGFYYTADNSPAAIFAGTSFGDPAILREDGNGFSMQEEIGDNHYHTEKILDGFYYYEAHF